jgi:5-methylcytosine-specific restriction endonuclease McrA
MRRTYNIYRHQMERAKEKGVTLSYSLNDVREAVRARLDNAPTCCYCGGKLTAQNFSMDHVIPLDRGGSWDFSNTLFPCDACNRAKGVLTDTEFTGLLWYMGNWDAVARKSVIGRLKAGAAIARIQFIGRKKKEA